ncbi:GPI2-domain-containing protein, partial [Hortaea werneckii]
IFVCCFTAIFQERVSPQTVVGWATSGTVAGWVLRDWWQSEEDLEEALAAKRGLQDASMVAEDEEKASTSGTSGSAPASATAEFGMPYGETPMAINAASTMTSKSHSRNPSTGSTSSNLPSVPLASADMLSPSQTAASSATPAPAYLPKYPGRSSSFSPRMQERLTTAKSAILIYCSLLGLSPILKSLTKSTSSDSIWALSSWLLILNIFTFDYGAGPEVKFPASLSTNAALMASTVLASRLPSTTHVFSLTLFSIEVFGLFPVFRRHLRHHSWPGHLWLTIALVSMASGGLSITISGGGWGMGVLGILLGGMVTCLSLGLTSWWLIGLQRYKNEIHGPWDPARPIIRRHWD